jgi:hypothetical protein
MCWDDSDSGVSVSEASLRLLETPYCGTRGCLSQFEAPNWPYWRPAARTKAANRSNRSRIRRAARPESFFGGIGLPNLSVEDRLKRGLCSKCGEKPLASKYFCKECLAARRERAKALRGRKAS